MNRYVRTPDTVTYKEVIDSQYKLSSSLFLKLVIPNAHSKKLADFLSRKLNRSDLGVEVGSLSYIDKSPKYFFANEGITRLFIHSRNYFGNNVTNIAEGFYQYAS